ncbi:MAG: hypothetical protein SNJ29_09845 [Rikenellaceae bacterium]
MIALQLPQHINQLTLHRYSFLRTWNMSSNPNTLPIFSSVATDGLDPLPSIILIVRRLTPEISVSKHSN